MKIIKTSNFIRLMSDLKTQPSSFPGENNSGQSSMWSDKPPQDDVSISKRWDSKKKNPVTKNYQTGILSPKIEDKPAKTL